VGPYLGIGAASFLGAAGIIIHAAIKAINSISTELQIGFVENIIGSICFFIGFASIIVILVLIAIAFEKKRQETVATIILLSIFIILEIARSHYTSLESSSPFIYIGLIIFYGVLRGIALQRTNKALKIPFPGYGTKAFSAYGWSYIVIGTLSIILTFLGAMFYSMGLLLLASWLLTFLYFFQAICYLVIGFRFIQYIFANPVISATALKRTSTTTTGVSTTIPITAQPQDYYHQEVIPQATVNDEFEIAEEYCSNCGATITRDNQVCEICGEARK